jgi:polyketide biosynthesis 3-hydroxy-3-methylglutaryl-CoA synthase-like enzyme PksG
MIRVGIEAMNVFGGSAYVDVEELARYRKLDMDRFENLLMKEKTVALPFEDPVTFGVNAAKPLVDGLSAAERDRIEMVITCTESGIDFGKSISTYIHHCLGLNRNCRLFEIKQACYSGTAGLQTAMGFVLSQVSPGAKALVVASDLSRSIAAEPSKDLSNDWSFAELSVGAGAVAFLVSEKPNVFVLDVGANGYYGFEVMDTCRPIPDCEAGSSDISLLAYLECCDNAFIEYKKRVNAADFLETFQYLAFHTPFGGMVKGAHRSMIRKMNRMRPGDIDADFERRMSPGLHYCQRVANIMGGTLFLSLISTIDRGDFESPKRIGCFSYGSGCCSEFFSGIATKESQGYIRRFGIEGQLNERHRLSMTDYETVFSGDGVVKFGTRNAEIDSQAISDAITTYRGKNRLILKRIKEFHREYEWVK